MTRGKNFWASKAFDEEARRLQKEMGFRTLSKTTEVMAKAIQENNLRTYFIEYAKRFKRARFENYFYGKKGSVSDGAVFLGFFMMIAIITMTAWIIGDSFFGNAGVNQTISGISGGVGNHTISIWGKFDTSGLDNIIVATYFIGHIVLIAMAALAPVESIFFIASIIASVAIFFISFGFRSGLISIFNNLALTTFSKSYWIFDNLILLEFGFIILLMVVVFKTARRGDGF